MRRNAASAGTEAGCPNLHYAERQRQPPATRVFQRALVPTPLAAASISAMLFRLRLNEVTLQPGQDLLPRGQRQPQCLR